MSNHRPEAEPDSLPLSERPVVKTYLLVGLVSLFVYFLLMMDEERAGSIGALITIAFGVLGLLGRVVLGPILFMILALYTLSDPNFEGLLSGFDDPAPPRGQEPNGFDYLNDLLGAVAVLTYLMAQYRYLSLTTRGMPDDPAPLRKGQSDALTPVRPSKKPVEGELRWLLIQGAIVLAIGMIGWWVLDAIYLSRRLTPEWVVRPRVWARIVLFFWIFATGILLSVAVFWYLRMNRMSIDEARLILQDSFWAETRREQERIYRMKLAREQAKVRRAQKRSKTERK